jgi:hypothetical protein
MTDVRRPVHLAVLLGVSAGMYAVTLAGVAYLQSRADQALIDERAPLASATTRIAGGHDSLETGLTLAGRAYGDAASRYDRLAPDLARMETALDALAGSVSTISGAAQALPGHVTLPPVSRSVSSGVAAPATHAKTGASGH